MAVVGEGEVAVAAPEGGGAGRWRRGAGHAALTCVPTVGLGCGERHQLWDGL